VNIRRQLKRGSPASGELGGDLTTMSMSERYVANYYVTLQSRVRRQKLTVPQLVWKSPAFSGSPKFGPPFVLIFSQINPVRTLLHSFLNIYSGFMPSKSRKKSHKCFLPSDFPL